MSRRPRLDSYRPGPGTIRHCLPRRAAFVSSRHALGKCPRESERTHDTLVVRAKARVLLAAGREALAAPSLDRASTAKAPSANREAPATIVMPARFISSNNTAEPGNRHN